MPQSKQGLVIWLSGIMFAQPTRDLHGSITSTEKKILEKYSVVGLMLGAIQYFNNRFSAQLSVFLPNP